MSLLSADITKKRSLGLSRAPITAPAEATPIPKAKPIIAEVKAEKVSSKDRRIINDCSRLYLHSIKDKEQLIGLCSIKCIEHGSGSFSEYSYLYTKDRIESLLQAPPKQIEKKLYNL